MATIAERIETIRQAIREETVSWGELAELQSYAEYLILGDDIELLEWVGVPEHDSTCVLCETGEEPGHEH